MWVTICKRCFTQRDWTLPVNYPGLLGQYDQGYSRKMWGIIALSKYFCWYFFYWPDFHLAESMQIIHFCSGYFSRSYEICIHFFTLTPMQNRPFQSGKTRAELTCSSCWASGRAAEFVNVAKKKVKLASLSSLQQVALECVCFRFCFQKRPILHVDKILNPKLGAVSSCAAVKIHNLNFI